MKKGTRLFLIISTSLLIVSGVAYASFLMNKIENNEGEVIDNTYTITLHYDEITKVLSSLEEDSGFELPILTYEDKPFNGWGFEANGNTVISSDITSVKDIKNLGGTFVNNAKAIFRVGSPCDISLDYCTFYIKSTEDIYRVGDNVYNMSVNNSLFGGSVEVKLCGDNCTLTKCENTYSSKDFGWKKDYGVKSISLSTSELFPDMVNGNYKAADSYSIYGDQNWN